MAVMPSFPSIVRVMAMRYGLPIDGAARKGLGARYSRLGEG
jgi:hypothetical protein